MSTVKISDLPLSGMSSTSNTSNLFFVVVDTATHITSKASETQLAQSIYSNNILNVGGGPIIFTSLVGQFTGNNSPYLQLNGQNFNKTSSFDYIATADTGDNNYSYIDFGINNSLFNDPEYSAMGALDGYLYSHGTSSNTAGNLIIGTATPGANINFIVGGTGINNIAGKINSSRVDFFVPTNVTANSSSAAFTITQSGNGPTFIVNDSVGSDLTPFIIDANGNIGIATTSTSSYKLNVLGDSQFNGNVVFADSSIQSTAASPASVTTAAYNAANTVAINLASANTFLQANDALTLISAKSYTDAANTFLQANDALTLISAKSYTDSANTFLRGNDALTLISAKSYTDAANTYIMSRYLANTSGVVTAGDFNISGNTTTLGLSANGLINISATPYSGNNASVKITGSLNNAIQNPLNPGYMLQITGYANTPTRIVTDSYGANTYPAYIGRAARGSANAPLSTANGDVLLRLSGNGFGNTSFSQYGVSRIDVVADENYTEIAKGSRIEFWNTPSGSNTLNKIATFNASSAVFSGTIVPQKGFIYTSRSLLAAQTAITVDFSTDSSIRANMSAPLTISFANYIPGKVVELWITNTGGNQSFTHGCSALNSTINNTAYTVPGTSTIFVKYMSFGTDIGNTFCSITHT